MSTTVVEDQYCKRVIKNNHDNFYFGAPLSRKCEKKATHLFHGTPMCEHHFNRSVKREANQIKQQFKNATR